MILHRFAIGLLIGLSVVVGAVAQDRIIGVASVIDGDTVEIHAHRIRLFGIDAPEAASSACDLPANAGDADNERALRWPIESDAPR